MLLMPFLQRLGLLGELGFDPRGQALFAGLNHIDDRRPVVSHGPPDCRQRGPARRYHRHQRQR